MIVLASFDEMGNIRKFRAYKDEQEFWIEFETYPELQLRCRLEWPRVNLSCTYGHKITPNSPFPMFFIPEGEWLDWPSFYNNYVNRRGLAK